MKQLPEKANFRIDEVADYFGVSTATVRRELNEGRIKGTRIRGQWRIPRTAILEYQATNTMQSDT